MQAFRGCGVFFLLYGTVFFKSFCGTWALVWTFCWFIFQVCRVLVFWGFLITKIVMLKPEVF